jgi:putative transposase
VLVDKVAARLEALLKQKTSELEMTMHTLEVMPDHIHLFIEFDSHFAVAEI